MKRSRSRSKSPKCRLSDPIPRSRSRSRSRSGSPPRKKQQHYDRGRDSSPVRIHGCDIQHFVTNLASQNANYLIANGVTCRYTFKPIVFRVELHRGLRQRIDSELFKVLAAAIAVKSVREIEWLPGWQQRVWERVCVGLCHDMREVPLPFVAYQQVWCTLIRCGAFRRAGTGHIAVPTCTGRNVQAFHAVMQVAIAN